MRSRPELTVLKDSLAIYKDLKNKSYHSIFIAESEKVVVSLLESKIEVISLYLTAEHFESKRELIDSHLQDQEAQIIIGTKKEMEQVVGFSLHQGILAAARIPTQQTLDELLTGQTRPYLFIILDTIVDAENIGALYRTALAMGASAIIMDEKSTSPWIRRAVRVSMGAIFSLPTIISDNLLQTVESLKTHNIKVISSEVLLNSTTVWDFDFTSSVAVIFGSEGSGIRKELLDSTDSTIQIPMTTNIRSLNVTVAQGMVLYEIHKQRLLSGLKRV